MTDKNQEQPQYAEIKPIRRISKIWLIPIVALLVGAWMVYYQIANQGTEITIYFSSAEGLEAGKTKVRTRYVDVGLVTKIKLRENESGVAISARINKEAESLLREDSEFWIVTPKVSLTGVSGLGTLLSGPYIELAPGMSGVNLYQFEGLEEPPVTPAGTPGLHITLNSNDEFAYKEGDPVIYKGLTVGKFEDIYFNMEERIVYYNVFIRAPYHELITTTTRFWDSSGVRLNLGAEGLQVHTGNVETLLTNGVAFGIPEGSEEGTIIRERAYFDIHKSYDKAVAQRYRKGAEFVIMVEDSVRGLRVGAPVEYRGLHIGEVIAVNPPNEQQQTILEDSYKIPVVFMVQPGRVGLEDNAASVRLVATQTELWVEKGLRASLKIGNILTGAQYVDFQFYDDVLPIQEEYFQGKRIIPMISDEFAQLTEKLTSILDKINKLPVETTLEEINVTLNSFAKTAQSFEQTGKEISELLDSVQKEQLIQQLNATMDAFKFLAESYSRDSQTNRLLNDTIEELEGTLLELKPILNRLNKTPNSLIFTTGEESETVYPKAKKDDE